ncbi:MAG: gliding motility-associated C-terminal domain-containing protein [Crocinitomicaceae bacterium]|nr:gliding motility-associated C-terminal domain-containing protein [Crocinitomicaceae bacterium]
MTKYALFILALAFSFLSSAQDFEWLVSGGGPLSDKATDIAVDHEGNIFITGFYNEEATFGPFSIPFGNPSSKEVFVAKLDPQGNYLWAKYGDNFFDDRGLGLCLDKQGNVFVTGTCWGGMTFGSLSVYNSSAYTDQIFILKLDGNGNEIWLKNAGVNAGGYPYNDDHGFNLVADTIGNIYVTGFISNNTNSPQNATFDALIVNVAPNDSLAFLAKLDPAGIWQWVTTFDGESGSRDNDIDIDNENNLYIVGGFDGTRVFGNTTLTSVGGNDVFVVKYNQDGNFIYAKRAGGPLDDRANAVHFSFDNHIYITGEFRDKAGFGLDSVNNNGGPNGRDIFVSRMTKDGTFQWVKKAGSNSGSDRGNGVTSNDQGNIFVTGQFRGKADFQSNIELDSDSDSIQFFVAAIDTLGKWRWAKQGGGAMPDRGNKITVDGCDVYSCGYYELTMNTDSLSINALGKKDVFVSKISDACFGYDSPPPPPPPPPIPPVVVIPNDSCNILVSNVFSPNGDGVNDLVTFSDYCTTPVNVLIFNRWGNIVYQSDKPTLPWYGTDMQGFSLTEGVYFYSIKGTKADGETINQHGFITLLGK